VLVGAGPTGVELAESLAHMVKVTLRGTSAAIDPAKASIILLDQATGFADFSEARCPAG